MDINAKNELTVILKGKANVKCARIQLGDYEDIKIFILKANYEIKEWKTFFESLDFIYNNGYGGQNLFGTVWLTDGTWLSRGEYDGSEWWVHNVVPDIPSECY